MKFTNKNNRWYDENDNSWEKKEDAEKYAPTLTNCTWCANCYHCTQCYNCTNCGRCNNCSDCANCYHCTWCANCYYCTECCNCNNCGHCNNCSYCASCYNCTWCANCYHRTNHYRNKFRSNKPSDKTDLSGEIIEIKGMKYKLIKV